MKSLLLLNTDNEFIKLLNFYIKEPKNMMFRYSPNDRFSNIYICCKVVLGPRFEHIMAIIKMGFE